MSDVQMRAHEVIAEALYVWNEPDFRKRGMWEQAPEDVRDDFLYQAASAVAALADARIATVELPDLSDAFRRGLSAEPGYVLDELNGEQFAVDEARCFAADLLAAAVEAENQLKDGGQ